MNKIIWITGLCLASVWGYGQPGAPDTGGKRLLVVSGGGARGAWGVGVLSELIKRQGGYTAVFGTSTGSLMAPLILLRDMDTLATAYTQVTQSSIFNKSPFSVKYDAATGTVSTGFNLRAILRFIFGKKTFGESKNLLKLIHVFLTRVRYDSLIQSYQDSQMVMAVAVTNTRTGLLQMIYDSTFNHTDTAYENLCRWIWASANEPLYMSYVPMGNASYVDGGVREVIPIQEGLLYAINHDINEIDVVINNAKVPLNQNWNVDSAGVLSGLERVLGIYGLGTVHYNETYATLLARYFNQLGTVPHPDATPMIQHLDSVSRVNPDTALKISELRRFLPSALANAAAPRRLIHMKFYCMPDSLAAKYADELGFIQPAMLALLQAGKIYGADPGQGCFEVYIDREAMRNNKDLLNKQQ
jgi:predicted patatin/cPLA2 family phospholipase